jgi:hypothetical protein
MGSLAVQRAQLPAPQSVGRTLVPPSAALGRETGLVADGVSAPSAPPNSSVIALRLRQHGRRASCQLAGVEWDDGVAGSSSVWTSTECARAPDPPRRLHLQRTLQLQLSQCHDAATSSTPRVTCANPARRKGVERRVAPSAGLTAAGRWSYGNERCVGDLATVLLHSCVRPAPSTGSEQERERRLGGAPMTLAAADG